jgi:hypothetical protein
MLCQGEKELDNLARACRVMLAARRNMIPASPTQEDADRLNKTFAINLVKNCTVVYLLLRLLTLKFAGLPQVICCKHQQS